MKKRKIAVLVLLVLIIFTFLQFSCACITFAPRCQPGYVSGPVRYERPGWFCFVNCPQPSSCVPLDPSGIIKRSVPQGDFIKDTRTPEEACSSVLEGIQRASHDVECSLIDSKRVDDPDSGECVDGASVAGCFACTFECK